MIFKVTPKIFINFTQKNLKKLNLLLIILISLSCLAIYNSPHDYQQGNAVKIMYIHVPSAWLSLLIYSIIATLSALSFIYKTPILTISAISLAPIGCIFSLITLVTGSLWGKPIWGTWWVWDARLTSMLILFLLYLSYITLYKSYANFITGSKIAAALAIIGFINIPIIKFSVEIWNSLHQPASIFRKEGIAIHTSMLKPLLISFFTLLVLTFNIFLMRVNIFLLKHKRQRLK
jgi:heme exporter protein C